MGKAFKRFPYLLVVPFVAVAIIAMIAGSRTVIAGRAYDERPSAVRSEGLTADQEIQKQIDQTGRLMKDLPSASQLQAVRVDFGKADIDAVDKADKSSTPQKVGLVKAMTPAIEISGLDRGNSPHQGTAGEAL